MEHEPQRTRSNAHTGMTGQEPPVQREAEEAALHGHTMHEEAGHPTAQDSSGGHEEHGPAGGGHHVDHTGHEEMFRRRFWVCLALSIPVLAFTPMIQEWFGFSLPGFPGDAWIVPVFSVAVFLYGGVPFLQMAVPELQDRRPGMMTLISLAITVAFVYSMAALFIEGAEGFFWELVTLIDVMLLGHWLEMRSVRQASGALSELAKLIPDTAERLLPEGSETVPVSELADGDLVLVRPGASLPADGTVEEGESEVNQALLTGESTPIEVGRGSRVIAGAINGDGSLRVRVTATGEGTALAGIMRMVEEAQKSKSHTQILADRAAGWLFYVALGVAVVTAVAWLIAVGFSVAVVSRVATVLVIACPHALGLAIPLVVALVTSLGARRGILVRNRVALEESRRLDTVVFDKTGTLTKGEFRVVDMAVADGEDRQALLGLAAAVEADSEHPLAAGIRASAAEQGAPSIRVASFENIRGRGVRASADGREVYLGGPALLEQLELTADGAFAGLREAAKTRGHTIIYLVREGRSVAAFALADVVRPESRRAVEELHRMGIEVAMLTGDAEAVAADVARQLGIDRYFAQVLPENKDRSIAELQRAGKRVAMVGDGVNDAPALIRADVGIAVGSGTDVAIESADVVLVKNNPMDVVRVVRLGRAAYRKMVQNLVWAAGYNIVALPLAAGVLAPVGFVLSPAIGAVLMSASTVIVAINAQLLRRQTL